MKNKQIFLDQENFDILTLLQRTSKKEVVKEFLTPERPGLDFSTRAVPCSAAIDASPSPFIKCKPLKSEKDRKAAQERLQQESQVSHNTIFSV